MSLLISCLIETHTLFPSYDRIPTVPVSRAERPTQLMCMAQLGNVDGVNANLHEAKIVRHDRTALMLAAEGGHLECCKLLVNVGEAGVVDDSGVTALSRAIAAEEFSCSLLLFPYEGKLSSVTPLMEAAALGNCDQLLLNVQYLNREDMNGYTATMFASIYGNIKCLEYLFINEQSCGNVPLIRAFQLAIKQSQLSSIYCLLYHKPYLRSNIFFSGNTKPNIGLNMSLTNIVNIFGKLDREYKITPLMYNAALGQTITLSDIDLWATKRDAYERTALMYYAQSNTNSQSAIDLLIKKEAGLRDNLGYMAFYYAFTKHNMSLASVLYEAEMEKTFGEEDNAFSVAVSLGNRDLITFCLNINLKKGYTPAQYKVKIRHSVSVGYKVRQLIESIMNGCPEDYILFNEQIGILDSNRHSSIILFTALQALIIKMHYEHIPFLLGELGIVNYRGQTTLMLAACMPDTPALSTAFPYLVAEHGHQDNQNMTALMHAARTGNNSYVRGLVSLEKGLQNLDGKNALMYASLNNNLEAVKLLANHEQGTQDFHGYTALMFASYKNYIEIVKILMYHEAGFSTDDNYTALALAMQNGNIEVAKLLYSIEAEVKKTSINPLIWAAFCGDVAGTRLYKKKYLKQRSAVLSTALKYAASACSPETVALLLEEVGMADDSKNTALMSAARVGSLECVQLLKPYELGMKNNEEHTALFYAATRGHREIVIELLEEAPMIGQSKLVNMIMEYVETFNPEQSIVDMIVSDFVPRIFNCQ